MSWDEIYESWAGSDSKGTEWRKIYDSVKGLNQKAIDSFGVPIFEWQNKEITLKY